MTRFVEHFERRQVTNSSLRMLVLNSTILKQIQERRTSGEDKQGGTDEIGEDMKRKKWRAQGMGMNRSADEKCAEDRG